MKCICVPSLLILLTITLTFCNRSAPKPSEASGAPPMMEVDPDANATAYPLEFKKTKVKIIKTAGTAIFTYFSSPGHILLRILNKEDDQYEIINFDTGFNRLKKHIIARGPGPREILKPSIIGGNNTEIFIHDRSQRRLMFWDREFKNCVMFKKQLFSQASYDYYGYAADTGHYLAAEKCVLQPPKRSIIKLWLIKLKQKQPANGDIEIKKKLLHQIHYKAIERNPNGKLLMWSNTPIHARIIGNAVFVLSIEDYTIFKYDFEGRLLKSVKVKFPEKRYSISENRKAMDAWGVSEHLKDKVRYTEKRWSACWLLPLGKGFAVGRRESHMPSSAKWVTADYFGFELQYLGKIRVPAFKNWDNPGYSNRAVNFATHFQDQALFVIRAKEEDEEDSNTGTPGPQIETEEGEGIFETYLEKWTITYGQK